MDTRDATGSAATAAEIIATLQAAEWPLGNRAPWGVEGLDVPGTSTYVNSIDTHVEGDYIQWYLIEVCDRDPEATEHYFHSPDDTTVMGVFPSTTGETWVSYLAVCTMYGGDRQKVYHQWHPSRAGFFDRTTYPTYDIRVWFLTFVEDTPGPDGKFGW